VVEEDLKTLVVQGEDLHGLLEELVILLQLVLVELELAVVVAVHLQVVKLVVLEDQVLSSLDIRFN
jgi:hypothetical protein|tara:strand:- start:39 stop:236 length:198 start_codon:yes stop_codon:yes gene_type:complete